MSMILFMTFGGPDEEDGGTDACCDPIPILRADLLALIAADSVQYTGTYIITDIADEGAQFLSTSSGSVSPSGIASFYVPDYLNANVNFKGQLFQGAAVNIGEIWIWGNSVWTNVGGAVGSLADPWALDANWTLLARNTANGYLLQQFLCTYDITANKFTYLSQFNQQNENTISSSLQTLIGLLTFNNQWGDGNLLINGNVGVIANNRFVASNAIVNNVSLIKSGRFPIVAQNIMDANSSIAGNMFNNVENAEYIKSNDLNNSEIGGNTLEGGEILGNTLIEESAILNNKVLQSNIDTNNLAGESLIEGNQLSTEAVIENNALDNTSKISHNVIRSQASIHDNDLDSISSIEKNKVESAGEILENLLQANSAIRINQVSVGVIGQNEITNGGSIENNFVGPTCEINLNLIPALPSATPTQPQIAFCKLNDNCTINSNTLSGNGACIWDVEALENCRVNGNTLSGNDTGLNILISDIKMTQNDSIEDNVLSGDDTRIEIIHMLGNSSIADCELAEDGCKIREIVMMASSIQNCTFTNGSGKTGFDNIRLSNFILSQATDINITNCEFENNSSTGAPNLNLNTWARDIDGVSMIKGKGAFSFVHDFAVNPLTAGNSVFYGFMPVNSIGTKITISPIAALTGGVGALLQIGIETDDPDWGFGPTALAAIADSTVNTISDPVLAMESIELAATVADITGGKIQVWVEFVYD